MGLQLMAQNAQVRWTHYKAELCDDCFFVSWDLSFFSQSNFQNSAWLTKTSGLPPAQGRCCATASRPLSLGLQDGVRGAYGRVLMVSVGRMGAS